MQTNHSRELPQIATTSLRPQFPLQPPTVDPLLTLLPEDQARQLCGQRFANPFHQGAPSALARIATQILQAQFHGGKITENLAGDQLEAPGAGKMFGVLVVETAEQQLGFLRAFSGMINGGWELPGYVPPLFDRGRRELIETEGEATVSELTRRSREAANSAALAEARLENDALKLQQQQELERLLERQQQNRAERSHRRAAPDFNDAEREKLAQQSRHDKTTKRQLLEQHRLQLHQCSQRLKPLERKVEALDRLRRYVSRRLMQQIHDTYEVPNGRGQLRRLRELFEPREPPAGAGDCAGPKLLAYAYRQKMKPLALAEFWWGAAPPTGGRICGVGYPACRGKCGPILPFMLEGIDCEPLKLFVPADSSHLKLRVIHRDDQIVVVEKPCGLLSVPSSNAAITDSVGARLDQQFPAPAAPRLVHRLDLDTSGLLVAALDWRSHAILQRQFVRRSIEKRYIAWLDGEVQGDRGLIDLPLCVDLGDRPRHVHDPINGRAAITEWKVLGRRGGRTRVAFSPLTGRTHQLRVHAAHPLGLNAPIVGDPLYGRAAERMLLHAEWIRLRHPGSNELVEFNSSAPF